ncbi:CopD family protein [Streptomyces sp. OF3]|uniref:CopD family protein n=1 Tax=Streptomyces alkaliterrae TaxID=2213162 RepID=A0A7W3WJ02_9ACTN|nr:CopD family protein [Streptomyces alkaliterrae]MBB1253249.1 CopD family protein [Streptomyces alkaliterrae]
MSPIPPTPPADQGSVPVPPGSRPSAGHRGALARVVVAAVLLLAGLAVPLLGPELALDGTGEGTGPGAGPVTWLRTLLFLALAVHVGELFARALTHRLPAGADVPEPPEPSSWAPAAATVGFLSAFGLALIVSTGNMLPSRLADMDLGGLYGSRDGTLALVEVNAFLLAGLLALTRHRALAALPLGAVIVAEALRAHPEVHSPLFGSALTLVHLTCAALWTGGLLHVLRTARRWHDRPTAAAALLGRYSRLALLLFVLITATGLVSTARRLPPENVLGTAYGRVLVAKLLLVAAAVALAFTARRRLRLSPHTPAVLAPARAELLVLVLAVALSALLTAVPIPVFYQPAFWWDWF